ncbi:MAG TPA: hypothetical protein VK021_02470 [Flavobacteriaceae bacterium]|nr:hypothetical protein [Flavobacteriaceae bacterium]
MFCTKIPLFIILFFNVFLIHATPPVLSLESGSNPEQGIVKLHWSHPESDAQKFELQQSTSTDFKDFSSVYEGNDPATFISGLENGTYYYRVYHPSTKTYSDTLSVKVEHHSLWLAFTMLGLGGLVFIFTVVELIRGTRQKSIN